MGGAMIHDARSAERGATLGAATDADSDPPSSVLRPPTVLCEVTRGGAVESVHHGVVVVADASGRVVAAAGDPAQFGYF